MMGKVTVGTVGRGVCMYCSTGEEMGEGKVEIRERTRE